jgi:hypothetical protein
MRTGSMTAFSNRRTVPAFVLQQGNDRIAQYQ